MAINEEATFKHEGYRSTDLSRGSSKRVWAVCEGCGKGRWLMFINYRDLCLQCSRKTEEYRGKMSDLHRGKTISEEQRKQMSEVHKGKIVSEETRRKLSEAQRGNTHTEETRRKIGDASRRRKHTEEIRKKLSDMGRRRKHTEETRKKMSDAHRGLIHTEETRNKLSEARKGENNPNWNGGISFEPYCHKFNNAFKESVREKHGRVCFLCPTTEEENGKKLSVHHINYNKDCLCDDSDCEFVPLCIRCHSKTNNNRDYWETLILEKLNGTSSIL